MPAPLVESSVREGEEPVKLPPNAGINRMSDKFKEMLNRGDKPAEAIAEVPPVVPDKKESKPVIEEKPTTREKPETTKETKEPKIPREHFKALETQRDEFKTKWETTEARARELEAKAKELEEKFPKDYEPLKQKLGEYEVMLKKVYVEQSPEFKAAFDDKIAAGIDEIKEMAGTKADEFIDLISLPASARRDAVLAELTEDMPAFKQHTIAQAMREVRKLQKERAAELAKPSENFQHIKEVEAQRQSKERLAQIEALERAVKITNAEVSKETVHFQRMEGNEEHNARVSENEKMLREFATRDLAPDERARLSAWAVRGIRASQTDVLKDALIQKLQAELKAIQDANPSVQGGGKGESKEKPESVAERYKRAMREGVPS